MECGAPVHQPVNVSTLPCMHSPVNDHCSPAVIVLSIGGTVYTNNTDLLPADIGEGASALSCHTELTTCCRTQDNPTGETLGDWVGPDGNSLPETSDEGFYTTRGLRSITLNRLGDATVNQGLYCCRIPRAGNTMQTFCVNVQGA